jgi:hypothetical protein
MQYLNLSSAAIEVVVVVIGIMLGLKKKLYGWLIALTFAIYVFYDLCRFLNISVCPNRLAIAFSLASISILIAVIMIYRKE